MKILDLLQGLEHNAIFAGLFGTMMLGSVVYALKTTPMRIWGMLLKYFTVNLTLTNKDQAFFWVSQWMATHAYSKRARTLRLNYGGVETHSFTPGIGTHWLWHNGLVFVTRSLKENESSNWAPDNESFTIITIGRSQQRMRALIADAFREATKQWENKLKLGVWRFGWTIEVLNRKKRSLDTVFLPPGQKEELVADIEWFIKNEDWFTARGIPYRQGYLFQGPPGTGKTTLVATLAGHFDRTICLLNPAAMTSDEELLTAFRQLPANAMLVIEDVDCIQASVERKPDAAPPEVSPNTGQPALTPNGKPADSPPKVTLSGLLNAIDGVMTSEGHILIMTTNHPEKLDAALVRKGRINKFWSIGNMEACSVEEMVKRFFPDRPEVWADVIADAQQGAPRSPAYWQARFMDMQVKG